MGVFGFRRDLLRLSFFVVGVAIGTCSALMPMRGVWAQPAGGGGNALGNAEPLAREHIEKVLGQLPQFMRYGQAVGGNLARDGRAGQVFGIQGPKEHPWARTGNPNSDLDYYLDSFFALDARPQNAMNWSQAWSCFEPKLLAKAKDGRTIVHVAGPDNEDLIAECRSKCINRVQHIPFERGNPIGAAMYRALGCVTDPDPWGYIDNGYEVVEFWFPEYQVSINNYGINRIRPERLSPTGRNFMRPALLQAKLGAADPAIQQGLDESYPLDSSEAKRPDPSQDPYLGQGVAAAFTGFDHKDKSFGHVVRTWLSTSMGEKRKDTEAGWQVDPDFSLYDAMPERIRDHDPVNLWTEYGMFEMITSIPHFSYKVRPDIMNAMLGPEQPDSEKAVQPQPFWQTLGATAYRIGRWPQIFRPLQQKFEISPNQSEALKEAVYMGGYELFPLVTNQSGFGSPALSTAAVFARRVLYIAGARSPAEKGGDESGIIEKLFPQGEEQGRIKTYTINSEDKGREIDKLQLASPKRMKHGTEIGGVPPMLAECLRSQLISNLTNPNKKLQEWTDRNMPRTLNGSYSDIDFVSPQGGDVTFIYWNRRIGCFCDRCGLPTGSSEINDGGDGDKLYDKPRKDYCRYPLLPAMTPWSAWAKRETFPQCQANGKNESFYDGTGMRDDV